MGLALRARAGQNPSYPLCSAGAGMTPRNSATGSMFVPGQREVTGDTKKDTRAEEPGFSGSPTLVSFWHAIWRRAIFPEARAPSILAAAGLHDRVRNGNGWVPRARTARNLLPPPRCRSGGKLVKAHIAPRPQRPPPHLDNGIGKLQGNTSQSRYRIQKRIKPSVDENRLAEHIAVRTPAASKRGRLPRTLPDYSVGSLIFGGASRLDAFSAYRHQA